MRNLHFVLLQIFVLGICDVQNLASFKLNGGDRIIGGNSANNHHYPYQVSLQYNGEHICGSVLISDQHVLTAAHCTNGGTLSEYAVYAGSASLYDEANGGQTLHLESITPHEKYNATTSDYDLSLLKLCCKFKLGENVKPIKLPQYNQLFHVGTNANVTGWGRKSEGGITQKHLQVITIPIVDRKKCTTLYLNVGPITSRMLCAGYQQGGKDSCQGDSGGPLVSKNVLIGIVSWGYGCARPGYPGVYTSVAALRQWIKTKSNL